MLTIPGQPASAPAAHTGNFHRFIAQSTAARKEHNEHRTRRFSHSVRYDVTRTLHPNASHFHVNFASPDFRPGLIRSARPKKSLHVAFKDDVIAQLTQELYEEAVYPPANRMTIRCPSFEPFEDSWAVTIEKSHPITIKDVLQAAQKSMHKLATENELRALNERRNRAVRVTCSERSKLKHAQPYLKRLDFLEGKHYFAGLEWDKERGGRNFKLFVKNAPSR